MVSFINSTLVSFPILFSTKPASNILENVVSFGFSLKSLFKYSLSYSAPCNLFPIKTYKFLISLFFRCATLYISVICI